MNLAGALSAFILASAGVAGADCETYWLRLHEKDEGFRLRVPRGFPLEQFTRQQPTWEPAVYGEDGRYIGPASSAALEWTSLGQPAQREEIGSFDRKRIHIVRYSRLSLALLAEQRDGTYCPALLLDAAAGWDPAEVVASVGEPEIFKIGDRELLSLRVYYKGNGALQESIFLTKAGGQLVHVDLEPFGDHLAARGWEISSHGGGFCRGSLTWANRTSPGSEIQGVVWVHYRLKGRRLRIEAVRLSAPEDPSNAPCDPYYEVRRPRTPAEAPR